MGEQRAVAIVTGASRGIGQATAELFARRGLAVVGCARDAARLEQAFAPLRSAGLEALAHPGDVAEETQVEALFDAALERYGRLDILVNCAGVARTVPFLEMTTADWDQVLNVNLRAVFLCCRAAFRRMAPCGGGSIVNVSSLAGSWGVEKFPGFAAYIASKYGVTGLTESLSIEGRPHGIRVNAISPGAVDTELLRQAAPHLKAGATPAQIAEMIWFLAGEASGPLSGTNMEVFSNG